MSDEFRSAFGSQNRFDSPFDTSRNVASILLLTGCVGLFLALSVAKSAPANGYEVSIYNSTPLFFWLGVGLSLTVGLAALILATDLLQWAGGLVLSSLSILSIVALPIVRGYTFYGLSDSLRHLGAVRQFAAGEMGFFADVYPGTYVFSSLVSSLSGVPVERAMLLVVFSMITLYVVFAVLCVWTIIPSRRAVAIATVSALFLLPLNHISLDLHFHTFSMTTFFFPVLLYLVLKHLTASEADTTISGRLSSTDFGFAVAAIAIVLYHPQVAMNVIVFLGSIALAQFVSRRWFPDSRLSRAPPIYGQLLFLLVVFFAWNFQHESMFNMADNLLLALGGWLGGSAQGGQIAAERIDSADSVGVGPLELFVKLFLVSAAYVLVAGGAVLAHLSGYVRFGEREGVTITTFAISGVVLAVFFLAHFVGDVSGYFFRHIGFGMILAMIVAVIGLTRIADFADEARPPLSRLLKVLGIVGLAIAMTLSVAVIFPSPYISQPSHHVSQQQYEGHAAAFEYRDEEAAIASARGSPRRYATAMGSYVDPRMAWGVPPQALPDDLRHFRGDDYPTEDFYYYVATEQARQQELIAYGGVRYDERDFTGVPKQPGVSRTLTNGEVAVYHVPYADGQTIGPDGQPIEGDASIDPPVRTHGGAS